MTLLVLLVLGVSVSVTLMRFGVGVLQDSFAAQLSTTYRISAEFLSLYALLNLYVYTMAYVYSPTNTAVLGKLFILNRSLGLACQWDAMGGD